MESTARPNAPISLEALHYLGFSESKADEIWNKWTNWPSYGFGREVDNTGGLHVTFIDFIILAHVKKSKDVHEDDDLKWRQCLNECGMRASVQDAIMDANFKQIRMTKSCVYWVTDTIEMRYAGLTEADRAPFIHSELWDSDLFKGAKDDPESIILFKGIDLGRIHDLFHKDGTLHHLSRLLSMMPSDFSSRSALYYFTPDMEVAEFYAAYAKRRAACEAVVMVTVHIPKQVILNMKEPDVFRLYYPMPIWKQLVWLAKNMMTVPKTLRKYRDATLIIGTISTGAEAMYRDMTSWEEIDGHCVLRVGQMGQNNVTEQYVFSGEAEGDEFLTEHGKFNVFSFSEGAVASLVRRHCV